jgi:hypothetical protein
MIDEGGHGHVGTKPGPAVVAIRPLPAAPAGFRAALDGTAQLIATGFSTTVHCLAISVGSARKRTIVDTGQGTESHFVPTASDHDHLK